VTVLVSIIAVFIAYNANKGLPFVPTYDLKAELPSGGKLVKGNEVRAGGFRVGVVDDIKPKVVSTGGQTRSVAIVTLKLDKTVDPLAVDTTLRTRPRSALGLKYIDVTPGKAGPPSATPLRASATPSPAGAPRSTPRSRRSTRSSSRSPR
jgi:ABC-type transporter Mla subunit MlaD